MCVYEPSKTIQFTFWSIGDSYFALGDFPLVRFIDDDLNLRGDELLLIMITMTMMVMLWKIKKAA